MPKLPFKRRTRQQGRAVVAAGRRRPKQAQRGPCGRSWRRRGACARRGGRRTRPGSWGRPPSRRVPEQAQACLLIAGTGMLRSRKNMAVLLYCHIVMMVPPACGPKPLAGRVGLPSDPFLCNGSGYPYSCMHVVCPTAVMHTYHNKLHIGGGLIILVLGWMCILQHWCWMRRGMHDIKSKQFK